MTTFWKSVNLWTDTKLEDNVAVFPAYLRQACLVSVIPGSMALSATRVIEGSEGRRSFYEYGQRQEEKKGPSTEIIWESPAG
jgi:hypothetical protein